MDLSQSNVSNAWKQILEKKFSELQEVCPNPLPSSTFESASSVTRNFVNNFKNSEHVRILQNLAGTFEHVRGFTNAINNFAQFAAAGSIIVSPSYVIWGSIQLFIECVCRFTDKISTSLGLPATINKAVPLYERTASLFPDSMSLKACQLTIFEKYLDSFILMFREFRKTARWAIFRHLLKPLISSKYINAINAITEEIKTETDIFYRISNQEAQQRADAAFVQNSRQLAALRQENSASPARIVSAQPTPDSVHTLPSFFNALFVGREEEITNLHRFFNNIDHRSSSAQQGQEETPCCVIHGLGGQGKTQIALVYATRYRTDYFAIFWLHSSSKADIERSLANAADCLSRAALLPQHTAPLTAQDDTARKAELATEWLKTTDKKWLLVFDNVEDGSPIYQFLPSISTQGAVIITSQKANMPKSTNAFLRIEVGPLDTRDGSNLLFKIWERDAEDVEEEERAISEGICRWVGGLPLAIVTIAGYLKCSSSSIADIFANLKRSSQIWRSSAQNAPQDYDKTLATVFDLALSKVGDDARHLLYILAFLDPQGIPENLLKQEHTIPSLAFLNENDNYLQIRFDLGQRQLVKMTKSPVVQLEIHRSLQMNLLQALATDAASQRTAIFREATSMVKSLVPTASRLQQNETKLWPDFAMYTPQVLSLLRNGQWPNPPLVFDLDFARLLSNVGTYLWHMGQVHDCDTSMREAEKIILMQPPDIQNSSKVQSLLSDVYLVTGIIADCVGVSRRKESLQQRQTLLRLREEELRAIPPDSVTTDDEIRWGNAEGDLACAYMQRGRYSDAKIIMEKLYSDYYQKWGSEDEYPFEYSKYYHYMGFILMSEGNPREALRHAERSLELEVLHAGEIDSSVLITKYDLASLYYNAGQADRSLAMHEEVLQKRKIVCGKTSQYTLESLEVVGILRHLAGRPDKAVECFRECLTSLNRGNWTEEGVARARYWYSKALEASSLDPALAIEERKKALNTKNMFLNKYSEFLLEDPNNEAAVFDQMLPMWILQLSGPLQEGGRSASVTD